MRLAMSIWQGRISPVFDVSRTWRIVTFDNAGAEAGREEIAVAEDCAAHRVLRLTHEGVGVLICGAISARLAQMIAAADINVIPFVAGEAQEVLEAYRKGNLPAPEFTLPGCCGRNNRRRCRRKHGRAE